MLTRAQAHILDPHLTTMKKITMKPLVSIGESYSRAMQAMVTMRRLLLSLTSGRHIKIRSLVKTCTRKDHIMKLNPTRKNWVMKHSWVRSCREKVTSPQ
ncbi:unnamed protein product [Prunus armeniaca]